MYVLQEHISPPSRDSPALHSVNIGTAKYFLLVTTATAPNTAISPRENKIF